MTPPELRVLPWRRLAAYTGAGIVSGIANVLLFHTLTHAHFTPHLAWAIAFEAGAILAFVLHRNVTWRDRRTRSVLDLVRQLWRAQAGSVAALVFNLAVFTTLFHVGVPDDIDDAMGILAGFVINYALAYSFVYGPVRISEGWHRTRRP